MVWISKKNLNALKTKQEQLESELKGYYDGDNTRNEYFQQISSQLTGLKMAPWIPISREKIKETYETCAPVMGVVNYIADNVGEVMRYLELVDKNGKVVENHFIVDLLRRPNDRYSIRKFGQGWAVNKCLFGDAFVYAPKTVGKNLGQVKEMYLIPSQKVGIKEGGAAKPFEGIKITTSGKEKLIKAEQVFESFDYNLDDTSFFGTSKIIAAAVYLSVIQRGMNRQDTSLKNGGVANIISPAKDTMGVLPKDKDDLEESFNDAEKNAGSTKVVRAPIDVHELGNTPVDLNILGAHKEAVTALCFVFKLPVDLYYGQAKYENAKEAKKAIYEQCAIPMANEFGEDLLRYCELDKEGYELRVNTDMIDVLQEDPSDTLDNLAKMHATLNEMREAYGYEPRPEPWADLPILPMAVQFGNETDDVEEPKEPAGKTKPAATDGEEENQ